MGDAASTEEAASWPTDFSPGDLGLEDWVGISALLAIMAAMSAGVFCRYVLNDSLSWSEEFARYGLIYVTFIGTSTAIRRRTHVRVDVIDLMLGDKTKGVLRLLMDALCLLFLVYLCWRTIQIMGFLESSRSPAMQIPVNWIYGGMLVGFAMGTLRQLTLIANDLKGLRT
ncbi:MAG: TRAP transporter small permease [Cyanobacteria bacterium K_DeepCast_35m_m2_023]|nr:TRAP transporter small permease [Cyanobacteria bacterium K_DeepCast_35m_m2_023]